MQISEQVLALGAQAEQALEPAFRHIDAVAQACTAKVLAAFQDNRVSEAMFAGTTGYGYDDRGRDTLEKIYAQAFGAEDALVRLQFVNGTHTLAAALFGLLRPGDTLLSAYGAPYDTLCTAIGIAGDAPGSLKDFGVRYREVAPAPDGSVDRSALAAACRASRPKVALIQRSRGYSTRAALTVQEIGALCDLIHEASPGTAVGVDNCYGEFCQTCEPTELGADLIAGSLIKNPGGGLAVSGGYIAGRHELVEMAAARLTSPGIGRECGATFGQNRLLYQGFFLAPHVVAQALKTAAFCAEVMQRLGYETAPEPSAPRADIVQTIRFGAPEALRRFCRGVQLGAPVDSFVTPEPWAMPGYNDPVIMAAGAVVQGASIELSADGPMREPYIAYLQGGLSYESGRLGILLAAEQLRKGD